LRTVIFANGRSNGRISLLHFQFSAGMKTKCTLSRWVYSAGSFIHAFRHENKRHELATKDFPDVNANPFSVLLYGG
jgi:hypothetical protein